MTGSINTNAPVYMRISATSGGVFSFTLYCFGSAVAGNGGGSGIFMVDGAGVSAAQHDAIIPSDTFYVRVSGTIASSVRNGLAHNVIISSSGTFVSCFASWNWRGTVVFPGGDGVWAGVPTVVDFVPLSVVHSFPWVGKFQLCKYSPVTPPAGYYCILNEDGTYILLESNDKIEVE